MVDHGHVVAMTVAAGDTNRAGEHEQDAGREFAGFKDSLTRGKVLAGSETRRPFDFVG